MKYRKTNWYLTSKISNDASKLKAVKNKDGTNVVIAKDEKGEWKYLSAYDNFNDDGLDSASDIVEDEEEVKELQTKLSAKYNKTVVLENEVDKSVLGGVLVRLGNEEIDGTVKTRLAKMKEQLSQVIS